MNMRRGLFRLWLVISGAWVALCVVGYAISPELAPGWASSAFGMNCASAGGTITIECANALWANDGRGQSAIFLVNWISVAVVVPAVLLVLGAAFVWAGSGFRPERATLVE